MRVKEKPIVKELEQLLGQLMPLKHFMVTAFARNAFFLLIKACGWEKPAEIIIPAFTCPVIKYTVEAANAVPIPVDAEVNGINIDPELIKKAITANTRAIYVVHTYGNPAQIQKICSIAREHDLVVIEDLAHSLFTAWQGEQLGTYGDYAILSFTKEIIDFEGGAIATNNSEVYQKMLTLREEYQQKKRFSLGWLIDSYVRLIGSWWESGFSRSALCFMRFNDWINEVIYKGSYGIRIDHSQFHASAMGSRLALLQLKGLQQKKSKPGSDWYEACHLSGEGSPPATPYNIKLIPEPDVFIRRHSFRTWHNPYKTGLYPRADSLFQQLRVFSRMKTYSRESDRVVPETQ